ncbi:hypothetical protein D3C81_1954020 [compost metagenome]
MQSHAVILVIQKNIVPIRDKTNFNLGSPGVFRSIAQQLLYNPVHRQGLLILQLRVIRIKIKFNHKVLSELHIAE